MKVKVSYSKSVLEATINFISSNNRFFLGKNDNIRKSILEIIDYEVKKFPESDWSGTMGFYIYPEIMSMESMDEDENSLYINFYVDPGLGIDDYNMTDEELEEDTFISIIDR